MLIVKIDLPHFLKTTYEFFLHVIGMEKIYNLYSIVNDKLLGKNSAPAILYPLKKCSINFMIFYKI